MKIKAIALDMDGTLLDANNKIHDNLMKTLSEIRHKGVKVLLVTGRTMEEIEEIIPDQFAYDGAVTSNGMGCYIQEKEVIQYHLDKELVQKIIQLAQSHQVYYEIHSVHEGRHALKKDKVMLQAEMKYPKPDTLKENEIRSRNWAVESGISWVDQLDYNNIVKMYFFSMDFEKMNKWKQVLESVKHNNPFTTSSSSLHNVEIMKEGVNKATGLEVLLEQLKLSEEELMAVGDGENDLPMFELCSYSVAMRNAPDIVKKRADTVTEEPYDNHGLYKYLNKALAEGVLKK